MRVISKPLSELHKIEKNIRRHPEKQIKEYVRSLKMFGQVKPVVIDETGQILAGNGLFEALQSMGAETCQCYVMEGLSPAQKKKLMLADNRVYELGITDTAVFDEIVKELEGDIDPSEVEAVTGRERSATVDTAPAAPVHEAQRAAGSAPVPPQEPHTVICPKCGEQICL